MPEEGNVEVQPSADNGNVPVDAPSPAPTPAPAATPAEPASPAEPKVELFDLPDGRKVDATTLSREWKENFLPDYTRKSQALAAKAAPATGTLPETKPADPYADPNWVPKTYGELIEVSKKMALAEIDSREQSRIQADAAIEQAVLTQLDEIKKTDPNLNENALFLHANKYGFRDLVAAHKNMRDMNQIVKDTKKQTAQDIQKRNDPVSNNPGAVGAVPNPSSFSTARDFLRSLKA